ncbi:MAG: hypothetical protein HZA93_18770 [Verrucomicrobia bacterium]|nr:hypothetical protein [Verrucomicrobiota bacterium]
MSFRPSSESRPPGRGAVLLTAPAEGAVRQPDGQRAAVVPLSFLTDLREALGHEFGASARHICYCTGFDWALRDMVRVGQRLRGEPGGGGRDLWQMDAKPVLDTWWGPLDAAGWGACRFTRLPRGIILAEVTHTATAAARREQAEAAATPPTEPACDLYAGLFAGALSFFERAERHAVEVQCAALGLPHCLFVAGASPEIDQVEAWRHLRLPAEEVRQRLTALGHVSA